MTQLLPEVFTLIGINLFLVLSLVTFLLDNGFPKGQTYVYQVVALFGLGYLMSSNTYLASVENNTRFWLSFAYLIGALSSIVASNFHMAVTRRFGTIAKAWFGAFTVPSIMITLFFVSQFSPMQGGILLLTLQVGLMALALTVGIGLTALLNSETTRGLRKIREVKQ